MKQKEQSTRITFQNNYGMTLYPGTEKMMMEEWLYGSIKISLLNVGQSSQICHSWEIYKLFFILHNVHPIWIEVAMTTDLENIVKVHTLVLFIFCQIVK